MGNNNDNENYDVNESLEKIRNYYNSLRSKFIDRDEILKLMIVATVAQEPLLL